jgi:hypothetical protein
MLVVAVVQGRDVSAFGGWNLRGELLDLMDAQPGSVNLGRFRNSGQGDTSNGFSQSFAIIGLARTGTVPPEAVAYLVNQQCPAGGFRLFFTGGATCTNDDQADPDTTALATQALEAAKAAGAVGTDGPMAGGLDWLEAKQYPDGALPGSGPTALVPNANSTGIAAQALRAGGRTDAADLAVAWVRSMQLDCDAPGVAGGQGAVAYDPAGHDAAVAAGSIGAGFADQYRRTTAMATLGLGAVSFATLTTVAPGGSVEFDCEQVPPSSSTSSTSSTSSSTTSSTSSTTSSTSTTSAPAATSTSTTIAAVLGPSASAVNNVAVEAATQVAGSGSSGSGSSGLAVTGADAMSLVALGFGLASVGSALIAARRRR